MADQGGTTFGDAWARALRQPGWGKERGHVGSGLLWQLARTLPVGEGIVELGVYGGQSTVILASAGRPVLAVDIAPLPEFHWVLQDFPNVTLHTGRSDEAPRPPWPIGLLYIDAGHDYPQPLNDLDHWLPWLEPGAHVLWDDWAPPLPEPGVTQSVAEALGLGWIRHIRCRGLVLDTIVAIPPHLKPRRAKEIDLAEGRG